MHPNPSACSLQRRVCDHARRSDAYAWFNVLTGPELFEQTESLLPQHRERLFPPTETLSMFVAQALSADRSCQNVVNETAVRRVAGALQYAHRGLLSGARTPANGDGARVGAPERATGCSAHARAVALARPSGTAGGRHHGAAT